jgi:hypothetical protein
MSRRGGKDRGPSIPAVYEGPALLTSLLARAGSPHTAEEVAGLFARAQAANEDRSEVIPGLFPEEPRFSDPDAARRLYSNLFGLWARVAAGLGPHDDAPEVVPEPPPPQPPAERGSIAGAVLPPGLVEAVWKELAAAPPRDAARRRDRFQGAQPDLAGWLDAAPLPESGALAAADLAFEAWAMFDQAFGDRLRTVAFRDLRALEDEPPAIESTQPALAAYVGEQLDNLADEDPAFDLAARAEVERALAAVTAALTEAVQEPS